ncbi:pectin lyase fold/virulence factor [Massariosphaeria phaeospora]|uniref:Pectin lyase fold/virulence factor n=1 Tax=Massariosphaeria phaeospora TaxID=100035 RepID=A0A7C8IBU2_9PLEO|nr:pectin lyase fold/virulence factor [Massariosphaeria phaeospora]
MSAGYEVIDDSPAINEALRNCGNGGTIILSSTQIYTIRTPVDFSPCKNCDFQIEGTVLAASDQWDYWQNSANSFFTVANAHGVRIRSVTGKGVVDGNGVGFWGRPWSPRRGGTPFVHITNGSTGISVENLHFKNVMQRFFILDGNSSSLSFKDLRFTTEGQPATLAEFDTFGYEMREVRDVDIDNVTMDFRSTAPVGICIAFDKNTSNVRVRNSSCRGWGGALVMFGTIFPELRSNGTASNITVSDFTFDGTMAAGMKSWWAPPYATFVRDVVWDGVTVKSGTPAGVDACYASMRSTRYYPQCVEQVETHVEVWFRNFRGKVGSPPDWGIVNKHSSIKGYFENWVDSA